ncbi:hypothetical protein ACFQ36_09645 [Arthrobacter sp. GCM10027362]|uniref:hypothetical protein n=1 Tax=Arthrobacter sp. GCM10027362 TaxID=3273379 RepID=UPI003628AF68
MGNSTVLRTVAIWLLCLMLTIAAGALTVVVVNAKVYGPQQQVRDYFQALQNGEGSKALGLLRASLPEANAAMLDGAALKQSVAGVEDIRLGESVKTDATHVDVPVSYRINGTEHTTTFKMEKVGTNWLFFSRWSFVPSTLPTLEVQVVNETEASLNGMRVALPGGKGKFAAFYPGVFEAHYTSGNFAAPAVEAVVEDPETEAQISLATRPTPKLVDEATGQIKGFLDKCAEQKVLQPAGCPFSLPLDRVQNDTIDWDIVKYPTVSIEPYRGSWVVKPLTGTAKLKVVEIDLFTGAAVPRELEQQFDFAGRLNVDGDNVSLTPVVSY